MVYFEGCFEDQNVKGIVDIGDQAHEVSERKFREEYRLYWELDKKAVV